MPSQIPAFFQRVLGNLGEGYPGLHPEERVRVRLIHLFLLSAVSFSALMALVFTFLGDYAVTWLCSLGIAIQSGELLLIRQRRYHTVKHVFSVLFPVYMVLNVAFTGTFTLIALLALPFVTLTMFLFRESGIRLGYVLGYFAALGLSLLLSRTVTPLYPVANPELLDTLGIFVALGLEVFFLNLYLDEVRRSRMELANAERKYHTLFEKAPFPLILYDEKGIADCNEAGIRILGAQRKAQLIGRLPSSFSPELQPDGRRSAQAGSELDGIIRSKGIHRFEWTHRALDGREFPVEITMASIHDGLMFGMWNDLSARKQDEARIRTLLDSLRSRKQELEQAFEALNRQRAFYEDILNGLPADLAVFDVDHRYLYLNPVAVRSEAMRRWLIGRTDFDYAREKGLPESMAEKRHKLFCKVLQGGHSLHWEDRVEQDGQSRVLLRRLSPVRVNGEVRYVVGYGTDITKIKEAETIIRDHNTLLKQQVEERTRELERLVRELSRSNADLESFAYAASHDLQEPLRMINSFLQMIRRTQGERLDEDGHEYIDFALKGVQRLTGLIKALLSYSKLGQQEFRWQDVSVAQLVGDKLADLSALVEERKASVEIRALPGQWTCEPVMLGMVFYNIVGNAIKFNRSEQPRVAIWAEEDEKGCTFFIRDNGIGIPAEKQQLIFEPFKRLHSQQEFAGTGIGLASCRRIVERHGGSIGLESEPGKGTTFRFCLPRQPRSGLCNRAEHPQPASAELRQTPGLPPPKSDASAPSSSPSFPLLTPRLPD
jgi:PAS domain S-box-containing protein